MQERIRPITHKPKISTITNPREKGAIDHVLSSLTLKRRQIVAITASALQPYAARTAKRWEWNQKLQEVNHLEVLDLRSYFPTTVLDLRSLKMGFFQQYIQLKMGLLFKWEWDHLIDLWARWLGIVSRIAGLDQFALKRMWTLCVSYVDGCCQSECDTGAELAGIVVSARATWRLLRGEPV